MTIMGEVKTERLDITLDRDPVSRLESILNSIDNEKDVLLTDWNIFQLMYNYDIIQNVGNVSEVYCIGNLHECTAISTSQNWRQNFPNPPDRISSNLDRNYSNLSSGPGQNSANSPEKIWRENSPQANWRENSAPEKNWRENSAPEKNWRENCLNLPDTIWRQDDSNSPHKNWRQDDSNLPDKNWRQKCLNIWRRYLKKIRGADRKTPDRDKMQEIFLSFVSSFVSMAILGCIDFYFFLHTRFTTLIPGFAAMAVILFTDIGSRGHMAQPRNAFFGHVLSAVIGGACRVIFDCDFQWISAPMAVSITIALMSLTNTVHPAAGATALACIYGGPRVTDAGWWFVFVPVTFGSIFMIIITLIMNNLSPRRKYPLFWY